MPVPMLDFSLLDERGTAILIFEAGQRIFLQDEPAKHLYVVRSGKVQIITFGTVLENVGPGGVFGEMALIDGAPRSAAAMATEVTEVMAVDRETFIFLISRDPEFALRTAGHTSAPPDGTCRDGQSSPWETDDARDTVSRLERSNRCSDEYDWPLPRWCLS